MNREPYADRNLLLYPGLNLSDEEKQRLDNFEFSIEQLTTDQLVYSMARQIESNFQTFYTVAEEVAGEEAALKIAHEIGRRYGGGGYAKLLAARGCVNYGSAQMMAIYQDIAHSIRGPKHTAALYAEWDDERCIVKRDRCIYFDETAPRTASTRARSRKAASRATWQPTRISSGSRCAAAAGAATRAARSRGSSSRARRREMRARRLQQCGIVLRFMVNVSERGGR